MNDVWDGSIIKSNNVSRSISSCISVAIHENEIAYLLSRIEKKNGVAKQYSLKIPLAVLRQRELEKLEFGINYNKSSSHSLCDLSSPMGVVVPYV